MVSMWISIDEAKFKAILEAYFKQSPPTGFLIPPENITVECQIDSVTKVDEETLKSEVLKSIEECRSIGHGLPVTLIYKGQSEIRGEMLYYEPGTNLAQVIPTDNRYTYDEYKDKYTFYRQED